jgi:hypothetical protein
MLSSLAAPPSQEERKQKTLTKFDPVWRGHVSKNALFAGSDEGGAAWGVVASLIETCKLNGVEPHAYLADVLAKLADGWPMSRLDELLPWAYVKPAALVA